MKALKLIFLALFSTIGLSLSAQTPMISSGSEMISFMKGDLNYLEGQKARYASVEGTPYLDDEFTYGSLRYKEKKFVNLLLRYNYYEGYFEFKTDDEVKFFDPKYTEVDTVWYKDFKYIYLSFQAPKSIKKNYMRLLNNGSTQVLEYKETIKLDPEAASGYNAARPARFNPRPEKLYVRIEGNPAKEFRNKKSVSMIFGSDAETLSGYIKKEKLKLKTQEDLIQLCEYYDSLKK
jgi:hypothetical protein